MGHTIDEGLTDLDKRLRFKMARVQWLVLAFALVTARPQTSSLQLPKGLTMENCGPPFNLTVTPNPLKLRDLVTFNLDFVAAYDMINGVVEAHVNTWPYHYKDTYCDAEGKVNQFGCFLKKGEKRHISASIWLDDDFKQKEYIANATLTNEHGQVLLCGRAILKVDEIWT